MTIQTMSVPRSVIENDDGGITMVFEDTVAPYTVHTINLGRGNYAALKALMDENVG